ncbi:MAG: response regulator [Symplocastrum torsivum CPER-KK1]|jgi:two-component system response regulator|uniref:Response regulator n=1 Tax=Symplocastrum torsivum CPER-KK1 TaxID=450513 RepID=A0A951PTX5_9CYAN|nr:response regulator [Symplocastrum torsivum CPER-KK1]
MYTQQQTLEVLLVEDDPDDVELTQAALERSTLNINLSVINDGDEVFSYLNRQGQYTNAVTPNLILLDLHLPGLDGLEVLSLIKNDQRLKIIPVIVLTGSEAEAKTVESYNLGANSFVQKPTGIKEFTQLVNLIEEFWLKAVKLPRLDN